MAIHLKEVGNVIGFLFGFFLFTTILFFILNFTEKLPENWDYFNILFITIAITIIGRFLKEILK